MKIEHNGSNGDNLIKFLSFIPAQMQDSLRIPDSYDAKIAKICKSACNSVNKPPFQNPTKSLFDQYSIE